MDLIPLALLEKGGPWVAFLGTLVTVCTLLWRGALIPGPLVERTVDGYLDSLGRLEKELDFWRKAAATKDKTIATQANQLRELMTYSAVGTHALEGILEEARKRGEGNGS